MIIRLVEQLLVRSSRVPLLCSARLEHCDGRGPCGFWDVLQTWDQYLAPVSSPDAAFVALQCSIFPDRPCSSLISSIRFVASVAGRPQVAGMQYVCCALQVGLTAWCWYSTTAKPLHITPSCRWRSTSCRSHWKRMHHICTMVVQRGEQKTSS